MESLPEPAAEYYLDYLALDGRYRTGYLIQSYRNSTTLPILPKGGTSYSEDYDEIFKPSQLEIKGCVDGNFNISWREGYLDLPSFGDYPLLYGDDGLTSGPLGRM